MRLTIELINKGLEALAGAKEAGAMYPMQHRHMERMHNDELCSRVNHELARSLAPLMEEMAAKEEVVKISRSIYPDNPYETEFRANVVVMKPEAYKFLCRLLRDLKRDKIEELTCDVTDV